MTPEEWDALPQQIKSIVGTFNEDEDAYKECRKLNKRLELVGWTCDYYLDGVPFDIKPITKQ